MKKKRIIIAIVLLMLSFTSYTIYKEYFAPGRTLKLTGEVETIIYSHKAEVAGKIIASSLNLGQIVNKGDIVAEIDSKDHIYQIEQLEAVLIKKQALLADLKKGSTREALAQAENNVQIANQSLKTAASALEFAETSLNSAKEMYENGGISRFALDEAQLTWDNAKEKAETAATMLNNSELQLTILRNGASSEQLTIAEADYKQSESQLRQAKDNLSKFTIRAAIDGIVINKNYQLGDIVGPGYSVADIAASSDIYLVTYVPVEYLPNISHGQMLPIQGESKDYSGEVCYIGLESEFTPKDFRSAANKNRSSVKIKLRLKDCDLLPGQNAKLLLTVW